MPSSVQPIGDAPCSALCRHIRSSSAIASPTADAMRRHTGARPRRLARSAWVAVCHSSMFRRDTVTRESVRTIASPASSAWCGIIATAIANCCTLLETSCARPA